MFLLFMREKSLSNLNCVTLKVLQKMTWVTMLPLFMKEKAFTCEICEKSLLLNLTWGNMKLLFIKIKCLSNVNLDVLKTWFEYSYHICSWKRRPWIFQLCYFPKEWYEITCIFQGLRRMKERVGNWPPNFLKILLILNQKRDFDNQFSGFATYRDLVLVYMYCMWWQ